MDLVIIVIASLLAGAVNSIAGSGTLVVFPILIFLGLSPHQAIATNIASLWIGLLTGVIAYRKYFTLNKEIINYFVAPAFIGAIIGAYLLLNTSPEKLKSIVPLLILFAVSIITFSNFFNNIYTSLVKEKRTRKIIATFVQFITGVYGSYFGAGIGLILLANLLLFGINDLHRANVLKIFLGLLINFTAFSIYLFSGNIVWAFIPYLIIGYLIGGYIGGYIAQKIKVSYVKAFIVIWGIIVALRYILR